jgi:hypothetical protein
MIVALTHIWSGVSSHAPDARIDLSAHRQGSTNPILVAPFLQYRRLHAHPLRVRCRRLPARSRKHLHYNSFLVILSAADSYRLGVRTESCRDRNRPALRPSWPSDAQRGGPRHHQQYMMHAGLPFRRDRTMGNNFQSCQLWTCRRASITSWRGREASAHLT